MEWNRKYALRSYLRSSLWVGPVLAYMASIVLVHVIGFVDGWLGWSWEWRLEVDTVHSVLEGLVAATISFIVFAFSSLLVAIQVASAQLTPRIIATTLLRNEPIRLTAALFVLSFVFDLGLLARTQTAVLYVPLTVALVLNLASIGAFL